MLDKSNSRLLQNKILNILQLLHNKGISDTLLSIFIYHFQKFTTSVFNKRRTITDHRQDRLLEIKDVLKGF
jgi:hypothetical protein